MTLKPKLILDVGCGVGYGASQLQRHYPEAQVLAVDNEEQMLRYGQSSRVETLCCADATSLPFSTSSVDLIFANLLLPWCMNWEVIFNEWRRVLRPEGLLMFSCFGPDTLRELSNDNSALLLKDMHEIGDMLVQTRFSDPVMDKETIHLTYRDVETLQHELQHTGMLSINTSLSEIEINSVFPVSFEIIYGHAFGPEELATHVADESGEVKIPLSFLRRQLYSK